MNLNKKQMLLVHNVLFSHLSNASIVTRELEDLMDLLSEELIGQPEKPATMGCKNVKVDDDCDQYYDEDEDEDEDECDRELHNHEECEDGGDYVDSEFLAGLETLVAHNANDKRVKLFFHTEDDKLHLSVNDGSVEFSGITAVLRTGRELLVYTSPGGFVLQYTVKKFPKDWTASLQTNVKYQVT